MNDRLPHGSNYTGIKAPAQSDGSYYQAQLVSDGRFRIAKNTGGLFGNWNDFLTNADFVDLTLNSGFTNANNNYGGRNALGYCKIGDIVYVAGGVGITNYSGTNAAATVLPSGYRPATNHYYFCATGGSRIARVYIRPDGNIFVEWVKNIDDGSTMTGEVTWIDLSTWFVAV